MSALTLEISACTLCADRFAKTKTAHRPRPVVWFEKSARILIAGQAPGMRVHKSGKPFDDPSGDRLRMWLGVDSDTFYDRSKIAIVPMAFCFPGYNASGSDLPPPSVCAQTWHDKVLKELGNHRCILLVGGYAHKWHLARAGQKAGSVTQVVQDWKNHAPSVFPLPHPSWRNTAWLKKNPWFEQDLLPVLKTTVKDALSD